MFGFISALLSGFYFGICNGQKMRSLLGCGQKGEDGCACFCLVRA